MFGGPLVFSWRGGGRFLSDTPGGKNVEECSRSIFFGGTGERRSSFVLVRLDRVESFLVAC